MDRFFPTREPEDPWFRIGTIDVTTTILICGLTIISMIVWAISPNAISNLLFDAGEVKNGQVWRIVTWPLATYPDLWAVLGIVIFFIFGREIERMLGRFRFLWFLLFLTLVPAVVATLLDLFVVSRSAGISLLIDGVFLVFVLRFPTARSFFNIPLWVIGAVFLGIEVLQLVGLRYWGTLWFLLILLGTAMLAARAMGILEEIDWLPKIPLPHSLRGEPAAPRRGRAPKAGRTRSRRGPAEVIPMRQGQPTPDDLLRQAEIDVLLDKISEHGLDSLTADERRRLDEHSRRLRGEG
jgi:membrane associated rhomboid family serine protease